MTPHKLHRVAAYLEMVTWALLIFGMILKYSDTTDAVVPITGAIHGFGFLCFVVMTVLLWINNRWPAAIGIAGLIVSVIPFAALPFAIWAGNKGYLEGGWRFRDSDRDSTPSGPFDWALYQAVRYPVRSIVVIVILVAIVFAILLALGPPVDVEEVIEG